MYSICDSTRREISKYKHFLVSFGTIQHMEPIRRRTFLETISYIRLPNNVRLQPYTKESFDKQTKRRQKALREFSFIPERKTSLPECEELCILPHSIPPQLMGIPLEEVDKAGLEKIFYVVSHRSTRCYLYRFNADPSLFYFFPWNPVRRFCITFFTHRYFDYFVVTIILINCIFLALSHPIEETEYVFLSIYTAEMIIKSIAKGFILDKFTYLRNAWNWLDFIVILSGYLTIALQAFGVGFGNLAGLRTFRVLRALKTVSILPGLKTIVNAMLCSIRMLAEVMTLTVFCLMVFALLALQLYMGVLRQKCVLTSNFINGTYSSVSVESPNIILSDHNELICSNNTAARLCPKNYTCLPDIGDNPNHGYTNFDSYGWAVLNTLQLITLDFWEDIYNKIIDATGLASIIFFILIIFLGSFYLVNLTLAVVAIAYEEEAKKTLQQRDKLKTFKTSFPIITKLLSKFKFKNCINASDNQKNKNVQNLPNDLPDNNTTIDEERFCVVPDIIISTEKSLNTSYNQQNKEKFTTLLRQHGKKQHFQFIEEIENDEVISNISTNLPGTCNPEEITPVNPVKRNYRKLFLETDRDSEDSNYEIKHSKYFRNKCGKTWKIIQNFLARLVNDPLFDLIITLSIILNTTFLATEHFGMSLKVEKVLCLGNLIFTGIFTIEAILKIVALGRQYFNNQWNVFDFVIVILSLLDLSFESVSGLSVLRTFRLLRVMKLAQFWPTMHILLAIIASTLGAVANMTLILTVIIYIFAILGMQLFADIYTPEKFYPDSVPRWNFTDFWHSLLLIFRILCGEWVQPLWKCMQAAKDKYQLCIVFFITVLTVGSFLVLNLFLAMLLNSFNSKELKEKEVDFFPGPESFPISPENRRKDQSGNDKQKSEPIERRGLGKTSIKSLNFLDMVHRGHNIEVDSINAQFQYYANKQTCVLSEIGTNSNSKLSKGFHRLYQVTEKYVTLNIIIKKFRRKSEEQNSETDNKNQSLEVIAMKRCYDGQETSFHIFLSKFSQWRKIALIIVNHKAFEWIILLFIFASSGLLCFEDIYLPQRPTYQLAISYLNYIFTGIFILEMLLKWTAFGFIKYFTNFWTIMDFIIVLVSILSIVLENAGSGLYSLRSIRTLRALRPLRAISRWQGMKIVVNALMSAIPSICNVLLVCIVFWLIFSIMGVQFFSGKFYKCVDGMDHRLSHLEVKNHNECIALNFTWKNSKINFDNVGNAYLALFQVASFEGWTETIADATDSTDIDQQPFDEANFLAYLYFVIFIIFGSFFTLNLFIGVIIDNFNMLKKKYEGGILEMFLTDSQRTYYTAMQKLGQRKPQRIIPRPLNKYLAIIYDVAVSRRFEMIIFLIIVINLIVMSFEHYKQSENTTMILEYMNIIFTTCFTLEAIIKITGLGYHYFRMPWNIFDFCIVIASIIGVIFEEALQKFIISPTLLRVIRLVRIGRILRLIKAAKGIRKLLFALIVSLPALFNIGALLFLVTFIYSIIGMSLFAHVKHDNNITDTINFETFAHSMALLFRLATSAGWNDILEPLTVQPPDCDPNYNNLPNGNCGYSFVAVLYLVSYIIINYMIIINTYIAIILENLNQANQEEMGITEEDIESFYITWSRYDPHAIQFISLIQLSDFVADLDPPLGIPKPNNIAIVLMKLPLSKGDQVHCLDILHALTKRVLGDVEETDEFKTLQEQIDQRFRKTFPTRSQTEIISNTWERKKQENAAKVIQRTFKKYKMKH
ncbi:sodium channel protein 1 brain-like [Centruroides vittatus]|uniref:sodium channel protein 1 brain-like n=1 Tax=Centruroides vittatus TaxID=120091 RepID=UPI00350F4C35